MVNASCSSRGALVRSPHEKAVCHRGTNSLIGSMVAVAEPNLMICEVPDAGIPVPVMVTRVVVEDHDPCAQ